MLQSVEAQLDKAREKLIMRCPEFNNKEAIRMFDPPEDKTENMHFFNVKKAFKLVTLGIETYQAKQIVQRFDSNFDEELSFSDITDIFKTTSTPLNQELERRTVFAPVEQGKWHNIKNIACPDYVWVMVTKSLFLIWSLHISPPFSFSPFLCTTCRGVQAVGKNPWPLLLFPPVRPVPLLSPVSPPI